MSALSWPSQAETDPGQPAHFFTIRYLPFSASGLEYGFLIAYNPLHTVPAL
jgi:hypothetical protein